MGERNPIGWVDLTVSDAGSVKDFYEAVAGWTSAPLDMGGYDDYVMMAGDGATPAGGICHARGGNAGIPPQWLIYITVPDLAAAVAEAEQRGGAVVVGPKKAGNGHFAVLTDPAGAVFALYQEVAA